MPSRLFLQGNPAIRLLNQPDPQLSVPRLLEVWLFLGIKEKPPKEYSGSTEGFIVEFF
jgi:hypothetical protein